MTKTLKHVQALTVLTALRLARRRARKGDSGSF